MNFVDPRSSAVIETETLWSGMLLCLPSELDICVFTRSPGTDTCLWGWNYTENIWVSKEKAQVCKLVLFVVVLVFGLIINFCQRNIEVKHGILSTDVGTVSAKKWMKNYWYHDNILNTYWINISGQVTPWLNSQAFLRKIMSNLLRMLKACVIVIVITYNYSLNYE